MMKRVPLKTRVWSRSKLAQQSLRVMCALTLVCTLIPSGSAFATTDDPGGQTESAAGQGEQVAEAIAAEPSPTPATEEEPPSSSVTPTPATEEEPVEEEPDAASSAEDEALDEPLSPGTGEGSESSLDSEATATASGEGLSPMAVGDPRPYIFELAESKIVVDGDGSYTLKPGIKIVKQGTGTTPATIEMEEFADAGITWDWTNATLEGFEDVVRFDQTTPNKMVWNNIAYAHYAGTLTGLKLAITDQDRVKTVLADEFSEDFGGSSSANLTDYIDILEPFTIPIDFDPTITSNGAKTVTVTSGDERQTYYVDSRHGAYGKDATFKVKLSGTSIPYSGITAASWELFDNAADPTNPAVRSGSLRVDSVLSDPASYPSLSDLQAAQDKVFEGTLPRNVLGGASEGNFTLRITATTVSGDDVTSTASLPLIIKNDTANPQVTLTAGTEQPKTGTAQDGYYYTERTVTLTISDANLKSNPDDYRPDNTWYGPFVDPLAPNPLEELSFTKKIDADGTYNFSQFAIDYKEQVTDDAGKKPGIDNRISEFMIDEKAPTPEISSDPPSGSRINFGQGIDIILSAKDEDATTLPGSGIWKYQYKAVLLDSNTNFAASFEDLVNDQPINTRNLSANPVTLTHNQDESFLYVLKVWDKAGNTTTLVSKAFIVDMLEPTIVSDSINFAEAGTGTSEPPSGIYNNDVNVTFTAIDTQALPSGRNASIPSGLSGDARYELHYLDSEGQRVTSVRPSPEEGTAGSVNPPPPSSTITDLLQNIAAPLDFTFTISKENDLYPAIEVVVFATDNAGNKSAEHSAVISIDSTSPEVVVSYDNNAVTNGRYFRAGRVATVSVTDLNVNPSTIRVNSQQSVGWASPRFGDKDTAGMTGTIAYLADGEYELAVTGADEAGNPAVVRYEGEVPQSFIIDQTAPVLSVAYDNNNVRNERYYNAARTGTVTIVEQNFNNLDATVSATRDGEAFSAGSGWSSAGNTHSSSVSFATDGEYTLSASYTDLAGNPAQTVQGENFVIDLTAPAIEFAGAVQNHTAHTGVVIPEVLFHDRNYDINNRTISIEGQKNKQVPVGVSYTAITEGEQGTVGDLAHLSENDDIYVLTATQTDLAGNETTSSITYSVNRFGSTWYLDDSSRNLVDNYYSNTPQEVQLHEVNVNRVVEHSVSLSHDGDLNTLGAHDDYQVIARGSDIGWKEYVYVLGAENFKREGLYEITVLSTDEVQNTSSNVSPRVAESACPVSFVIDKTAPTIVLTGAEDGGRYDEESKTVTIDVQDNTAVDNVEIYLNGSAAPAASYSGQDLKEENGRVKYILQASSDPQELAVVAYDVAGNISDQTRISDILIGPSASAIIDPLPPLDPVVENSIGLAAGVALSAVLVGTALLLLLFVRRRKQGEGQR
ncbi:MAG: hypothetical protein LBP24_04215 [Coriobacteriales bacterium]|jgi:hypothetical protein|nr:hypothetical protein [Coriobacteriales bacterium]